MTDEDSYWSPLAVSKDLLTIVKEITQESQDLDLWDTPEILSAERLDLYTLETRYEVLKRNGIFLGTE